MAPGLPGHRLDITVFPLPTADFCPPDFGYDYVGFDLVMTLDTGETRVLNHDTSLPANRVCPTGYEIAEVIAYEQPGMMVVAIMIDLLQLGFEGEDRRYLGLTTQIAE
jgi:predicted secreted protein